MLKKSYNFWLKWSILVSQKGVLRKKFLIFPQGPILGFIRAKPIYVHLKPLNSKKCIPISKTPYILGDFLNYSTVLLTKHIFRVVQNKVLYDQIK